MVLGLTGQSTDICALKPASRCAVTNLTADEILVTGGTVTQTQIAPVPNTFDYLVKVQVNPGAASLAIALTPGEKPELDHILVF